MFKEKLVSLDLNNKSRENNREVAFEELPSKIKEALSILTQDRRVKDEAQIVEVSNTVFVKSVFGESGQIERSTYRLSCTTKGSREFSYNLAVVEDSHGEVLDKFGEPK